MKDSDDLKMQCDNVRTPTSAHCHNRALYLAVSPAVKGFQRCAASAHYTHIWPVLRTLLAGAFFVMCDCAMCGNAHCHNANLHPHNGAHIEARLWA